VFPTFARSSVLEGPFSFSNAGYPVGSIQLALEVSHLVRLLVEVEKEIFDDTSRIPGDIAIVSVLYLDPKGSAPIHQVG